MKQLSGRTAIVTGAGSGIGRATAKVLAREGVNVGLVGRTAETIDATADAITGAGGAALAAIADLRDVASVEEAVACVVERWGGVDLLINNAAVGPFRRLASMDMAAFDDVIATNLRGAFATILAVLPHMRSAGRGCIVNVASRAAEGGYPYLSAYSASKHGLLGLSEAIDYELQDEPIRCHTLIVGSVDTPFHVRAFHDGEAELGGLLLRGSVVAPSSHPTGMLDADDVAEVIAMLCALPDAVHVPRMVIHPSHDNGPADLFRVVRRGQDVLDAELAAGADT